jgi:hypothetical protein
MSILTRRFCREKSDLTGDGAHVRCWACSTISSYEFVPQLNGDVSLDETGAVYRHIQFVDDSHFSFVVRTARRNTKLCSLG